MIAFGYVTACERRRRIMGIMAKQSRRRALRPLIIDDRAKAEAARVIEHAKAHHFCPEIDEWSPGDDPRFVAHLNTYRCVFTFTHAVDNRVYRHLSVSIPSAGLFPHPAAILTIATLFGFTGWDKRTIDVMPETWLLDVNERENFIQVAQRVPQ